MQINKISIGFGINNTDFSKRQKYSTQPITNFQPAFMGYRVSKKMPRFLPFTEPKMPTTVKEFLASAKDALKIAPLDAHKNAYERLKDARTIQDVQKMFFRDDSFKDLLTIDETDSKVGIIGIYKEFQEIFTDGILKSGEDFTVYLLRKLFMESKTYDEINRDLDNDLNTDIKTYFHAKYSKTKKNNNVAEKEKETKIKPYVDTDIIQALGIYPPDPGYRTSLRYTRDGYSDFVGFKISETLSKNWASYTEEQQKEIITKRLTGRDEWWNSLSYDEQLEIATGIVKDEELYNSYKKYKAENYLISEKKETEILPEYEKPKKKIKVGSNIKNKDLFVLWMKNNLEKFYAELSDFDKELIKIKRSKRMAQRWKEMTPEQKTEFINSLRVNYEPFKYVMIDAWNHSRVLINTLSEFLKSKQVERPVNVIYSDEAFKEFQSKAMIEFWALNDDLAKDFGARIKYSHQLVEEAIKNGKFDELKYEIEQERIKRINELSKRYQAEPQPAVNKVKEIAESTTAEPLDNNYKEEFIKEYKKYQDVNKVLPQHYVNRLTEVILERFPKEFIIKFTKVMRDKAPLPADILKALTDEGKLHEIPELKRMVRALEAAIASELVAKGSSPILFEMTSDAIIPLLGKRATNVHLNRFAKPDIDRINRLYNAFRRDIDSDTGNWIINEYFDAKVENDQTMQAYQELADYIDTYGQSIKIIFSDKMAYSDEVIDAFNRKFLRFMPQSIKDKMYIYINNIDDIKLEREISRLKGQIAKRYEYIPDDPRERYLHTLCALVRADKIYKKGFNINAAKDFAERAKVNTEHNFPKIPKTSMAIEDKLKMLAVEQAMEDETFRISKNYAVYSAEFEEAASDLEMSSSIKGKNREGVKITTSDGVEILIKEKPNLKNLTARYYKYYNAIKDLMDDIETMDDKIDTEELLRRLNPALDKPEKDKNIRKRIQIYFND